MARMKSVNGVLMEMTPEEEEAYDLQQQLEAENEWKRCRLLEPDGYGSIGDQLDLLFHDMDQGKLGKQGDWFKKVKAAKQKYPKK